jgi:hypothetical protein
MSRAHFVRAAIAGAFAAALPALAGAQTPPIGTARVVADTATIYARCDPASPARAVLRRGTTVTVEGVTEGWVSVRVDPDGERGCLRRRELDASEAIDRAGDVRRAREIDRARGVTPSQRAAAAPSPTGRSLRLSAFATAGLFKATATQTFDAVLDTDSGRDIGFGAQVAWQSGRLRGLFVEAGMSRFEATGERAFVHEGEVFPLGIPLTITMTPVDLTAGYRVAPRRRGRDGRVRVSPVAYFAGGGVGSLAYREADDEEVLTDRFTSYHVMGGADVTIWRYLQVGGEVRYRWVPDGLGAGGVSDAFNETDLGGSTFRVRIGVGF